MKRRVKKCGLDMYLTRKIFIGAEYEHRGITGVIDIRGNGKQIPINLNKVHYIEESVGYWRKANQIHKWFVDNVQEGEDDCKEYYVSKQKLKELLTLCEEVKRIAKTEDSKVENGRTYTPDGEKINYVEGKIITNPVEIARLLPTADGFFFGSTNYDNYYLEDIDYTIEILEQIFKDEDEYAKQGMSVDYYYSSSW